MTCNQIITTFMGALLYSFALNAYFAKFLDEKSKVDGFFASFALIGLFWLLNHGIEKPMISQSGPIWIDMAGAAGVGAFVNSLLKLKYRNVNQKIWNLVNWRVLIHATLGGMVAGSILYIMR